LPRPADSNTTDASSSERISPISFSPEDSASVSAKQGAAKSAGTKPVRDSQHSLLLAEASSARAAIMAQQSTQ
jgi:hypothetical protein